MFGVNPNPVLSTEKLTLKLGFDASIIEQLSLCDLEGAYTGFLSPAYTVVDDTIQLDLDRFAFSADAYIIAITTNGETYRRKVMITR